MSFESLHKAVGTKVQLERGGPDKVAGELVRVHSDYLTMRTEQNTVMYCTLRHIKAIVLPLVPEVRVASQSGEEQAEQSVPEIPVLEADTFHDLLHGLHGQVIQVNHGGPNAAKGILLGVDSGMLTIAHDMKDVIHYPMYHIRSVTRVFNVVGQDDKKDSKDSNGSGKNDEGKGNGNNDGKHDGKNEDNNNNHDGAENNNRKDEKKDDKKSDKNDKKNRDGDKDKKHEDSNSSKKKHDK